jgi:IMP dehydrogenase
MLMAEHDVRHVPVMENDRPVGILTAAEIGERADRTAGEVCDRNVYIVDRFEPLDRVLGNMADQHYAAALVVKEGKLVGIFTITDACRFFGKLLRTLFPRGEGDAA